MTTPPSIHSHYRALEEAVGKGEEALMGAQKTGDLKSLTSASKEVYTAVQEAKEALERDTVDIPEKGRLFRSDYEALGKVARDNGVALYKLIKGIQRIEGGRVTVIMLNRLDLADISGLSGLTRLTDLHLINNEITDISFLSGLTGLTMLGLGENKISDLTPLSGLTGLRELYVYSNHINDLSPIGSLTRLIVLKLADNKISDLTPLKGLNALRDLNLHSNPLANTKENAKIISALKSRGCSVERVNL